VVQPEEQVVQPENQEEVPVDSSDKASALDVLAKAIREAELLESPVKNKEDPEWLPRRTSSRSVKKPLKRLSTPDHEVPEGKRKKLYLQSKKSDPAAEKRRRDAINAKLNRDRKKEEQQKLHDKMEWLNSENKRLIKENSRLKALLVANGIEALGEGNS